VGCKAVTPAQPTVGAGWPVATARDVCTEHGHCVWSSRGGAVSGGSPAGLVQRQRRHKDHRVVGDASGKEGTGGADRGSRSPARRFGSGAMAFRCGVGAPVGGNVPGKFL
jgi:hypothetical protein